MPTKKTITTKRTPSVASIRAQLAKAKTALEHYTALVADLQRALALHPDSGVPFTEAERRPGELRRGSHDPHKQAAVSTSKPLLRHEHVGGAIITRY